MPTTLIGAIVDGKPNFITIAWVGIVTFETISLAMNKNHYTNAGIKLNQSFSVNVPSEDLMKKADYCGLVSGKSVDKSTVFKVFYGILKTAPMIEECPVNMECKLVRTVDFPKHDLFIGEIVETYCNQEVLTEGKVDLTKLNPILFDFSSVHYWRVGERLAKCWDIGKELKE